MGKTDSALAEAVRRGYDFRGKGWRMEVKVFKRLPEAAKEIRIKVFVEEQGFQDEFDHTDDISTHIVLFEASEPIAVCRFYYSAERQCYVIGRIAVLKEFRGRDLGTALLRAAEQEIMRMHGKTAELSAQVRVKRLPEAAKEIRIKVFVEEQGFQDEFDHTDDISTHIVLFEASEPIAVCRFYYSAERQCYVIGRIAVLKEFRGRDLGTALLRAAEQEIMRMHGKTAELSAQVRVSVFYELGTALLRAAEQEIMRMHGKTAELSAQVRVSVFYEKNGYVSLGETHMDEGCPHVWMKKKLQPDT